MWGIDIGTVTYTGVFYNKELFEKNGLKVPTTWSEMMDVSKKLQDSGVAPFTLAGKDVWPLGMVANGFIQAIEPNVEQLDKKLWSGETKFTDPDSWRYLPNINKCWTIPRKTLWVSIMLRSSDDSQPVKRL